MRSALSTTGKETWNEFAVSAGFVPVNRVADGPAEVLVYWRPGCPYCAALRWRLRRLGLRTTEVNIWADPAGAATVRWHAGGNETVPTVVIGDMAMVNPSGRAVLEVARRLAPASVDPGAGEDGGARRPATRAAARVFRRVTGRAARRQAGGSDGPARPAR